MKKRCSMCGDFKDDSCFVKQKDHKDGTSSRCKECRKEYAKKYRQLNREILREKDKKYRELNPDKKAEYYLENKKEIIKSVKRYRQTKRGRAVAGRSGKRYEINNPEAKRAQRRLQWAVYENLIVKESCERCGSKKHIHGHHTDYSKPLHVIWLCPQHHKDWHKENKIKGE